MERLLRLMEEQNELLRQINIKVTGVTPDNYMMDAHEAAAYIKQKYETILRWASEGKIPHSRPGRRVLFSKKALDEWLAEQERASLKSVASEKPDPADNQYGKIRKIS